MSFDPGVKRTMQNLCGTGGKDGVVLGMWMVYYVQGVC